MKDRAEVERFLGKLKAGRARASRRFATQAIQRVKLPKNVVKVVIEIQYDDGMATIADVEPVAVR